jgi:hypothetical protein
MAKKLGEVMIERGWVVGIALHLFLKITHLKRMA